MSYTEKHIVASYSGLLEGLSTSSKKELIESLSKSLKTENTSINSKFYKSFGSFASKQSAEEIITHIRSARKFIAKEIKL